MPLPSKVKTRFGPLVVAALATVPVAVSPCVAQAPPAKKASLGELAVSRPRPPVLVPPLLDQAGVKPVSIRINLDTQRLHLLVGGELAIDSPVSTGRKSLPTPCGRFEVGEREAVRKQDKYGNIVDRAGAVVLSGVYADLDPIPSGFEFKPVPLHHVLTLRGQAAMIHGGAVGSLPTSDGSVVVPSELAKALFGKIPVGCPVEIIAE